MVTHDWRLVSPAYGDAKARPQSNPTLQKYDASDPVSIFQKDPTASLPFGEEDLVYAPVGGELLLKTDVRKLFLATHKRFYLVVCELHCDTVGFPNASSADVCEAGFVVRKRVPAPRFESEFVGELGQFVARVRDAEVRVQKARAANIGVAIVDAPPEEARDVAAVVAKTKLKLPPIFKIIDELPLARRLPSKEEALASAEQELANWRGQLAHYVDARGLRLRAQGWVADPRTPKLGAWVRVAETPQRIDEVVSPLYPLVPDPRNDKHPARGRTLYYGIVPTASADLDANGAPRFDETSLYEIRCFVRRHDPRCPRKTGEQDCQGQVFWSAPTQRYRLADHFDLHGTSQLPVAVRMPSLAALKAHAAGMKAGGGPKLAQRGTDGQPVLDANGKPTDSGELGPQPCGRGAPFRITLPPASLPRLIEPPPSVLPPGLLPPVPLGLGSGGFALSIPMVTIVALFAMRIFLAILSLVFPPINFLKSLGFAFGDPLQDPALPLESLNFDLVLPELAPPSLSIANCLPPLPGAPA